MTPELRTPRLVLRPLELADAEAAQAIFPRWEIVRFLAAVVPWPYPPDGALTFFREVALPAVERGEAWHWTLCLATEPDRLIGGINLRRDGPEHRGFWVGLPWQRQGIATEACAAVNAFWFETLGMPVLRVRKAAANTPSRRISEREGMTLVSTGEADFVAGRLPCEYWELRAAAWRARRGP